MPRYVPPMVSTDPVVNAALDQAETLMRAAAVNAIAVLNEVVDGRTEGTRPAHARLADLHGQITTYDNNHLARAEHGPAVSVEKVA